MKSTNSMLPVEALVQCTKVFDRELDRQQPKYTFFPPDRSGGMGPFRSFSVRVDAKTAPSNGKPAKMIFTLGFYVIPFVPYYLVCTEYTREGPNVPKSTDRYHNKRIPSLLRDIENDIRKMKGGAE